MHRGKIQDFITRTGVQRLKSNSNLFRTGLILLLSVLVVACGGGGGGAVVPPTLTSITVTPANPTLKLSRSTLQLTATGHYSKGSPRDLTSTLTWASDNSPKIAVGTTTGVVTHTGSAGDSAIITATNGTITSTAITVTLMPNTFTLGSANDPLAAQQWHLKNTGQKAYADTAGTSGFDINAEPAYNTSPGYTGYGVKVAVVDTGIEIAHEDLAANIILNGSWNFINKTTDPTNTATNGDHGTSVSGLIASQVFNGKGGMGVAPEAKLKGFNFLSASQTTTNFVDSLGGSTASPNSSDVDVFNQSFGYSTTGPVTEFTTIVNQYIAGVTSLRGGKGALYVKAAGNGYEDMGLSGNTNCTAANALDVSCENANFDPDNVLPFNIVVGALNASGKKSSYSTAGSAIWVSAPGGEYGSNLAVSVAGAPEDFEPAMVTTDQSSCSAGYAQFPKIYTFTSSFDEGQAPNGNTFNPSCNYTSTMNGTSSATPVTVGVIALLLEANPALTWRDVKHILASTARQVDASYTPITAALTGGTYTAEQGWLTNGAGHKFHNWYGFGLVDASAAVTMATTTCALGCSLGTFINPGTAWTGTSSTTPVTIPDNSVSGATKTIVLGSAPGVIEAVQIQVNATHSYPGDLGIELTSPSGTTSILKNIRDGFTATSSPFSFSMLLESNAFYGETSNGTWTIKVVDGNNDAAKNNSGGTLTSWQIRIYGH